MLGIKTFILKKINSNFEKILKEKSFPKKSSSFIQKQLISWLITRKLKIENSDKQIQTPISQFTHPLSREIRKKLLPFNPNNLGNWLEEKPFHLSGILERKIIRYTINLLSGKQSELGGYLTSGGTESNLFIMWMGRNLLKKKLGVNQMIVIKTGLTHYSITKSADIVNIDITETSISLENWGMDPAFLEKTIKKEYKNGKRGFLIPLTLGYTITGSDDSIDKTGEIIAKLKTKFPDIAFFCWIDAAFSGIIKPFVEKSFSPFSHKYISAFLTDFHKFPAFPYPSGIVLYKKNLIQNIEKKVAYIGANDSTLLGSRSGVSAILTWYCLRMIGKNGFKKMIKESLKQKQIKIEEIKNKCSNIQIITQKNSVQAGIYSTNDKDKATLKKMGLEPTEQEISLSGKRKKVLIYKLYFLPFFKKDLYL